MSRAFITKIGAFTPLSVQGCQLWLDGTDINGNGSAFSVGGTISTWVDKSSLGNNMTGTSVTYTYDSTYGVNGPTFNGSSSVFNQANSGLYPLNNVSTWTVFTVNRRINSSAIYAVYNAHSSAQANYLIYRYAAGAGAQWYLGDTTGSYITFSGATDGITTLTSQTSGSAQGFINGSSMGTGSTSSSSGQATFTIGLQTGAYMYGFIFEVLVYNRGLSTVQQQQIEGYLAQKWGLVSSLPANHPGRSQTFYTPGKNPGIAAVPSSTVTKVPYGNYFPLSIAGCTMWLDGADSTKVLLNGSTVSQWTDKSAAGNNATQPTAGNQPSYSASGIVFAGNQWLITPIDVNPIAESFFIVFKTTNNLAEIFSGTNANGREVLIVGGVMYLSKYGTNPVGLTPNGGSVSTNTVTLFDYQYTTSLVTLNLNGLQTGSGTPPVTYGGTGTSYIGSSTYAPNNMYGTIYEIIYYNVSLTTNERQQVEGYLAWKWGITLTNTHPYYSAPPIEFGRPAQVAGIPVQVKMTAIRVVQLQYSGTYTTAGNFFATFTGNGSVTVLSPVTINYFAIGGGGGGGAGPGGGGGAGGLQMGSMSLSVGTYNIVIGPGGPAHTNGSNTTFGTTLVVALGGGFGADGYPSTETGGSGGCGGGRGSGLAGAPGTGSQGYNGGSMGGIGSGGGGGVGGVGETSPTTSNTGGAGGIGVLYYGTYYGGGGGGAPNHGGGTGFAGAGGLGGGGRGGQNGAPILDPVAGTPNTGGGGGGGRSANQYSGPGAAGGSGVFIISY